MAVSFKDAPVCSAFLLDLYSRFVANYPIPTEIIVLPPSQYFLYHLLSLIIFPSTPPMLSLSHLSPPQHSYLSHRLKNEAPSRLGFGFILPPFPLHTYLSTFSRPPFYFFTSVFFCVCVRKDRRAAFFLVLFLGAKAERLTRRTEMGIIIGNKPVIFSTLRRKPVEITNDRKPKIMQKFEMKSRSPSSRTTSPSVAIACDRH